jgi:predicted RNA binding protein YcfA (HicA-like mRNA interferase family)
MSKLPVISGVKAVKTFHTSGFSSPVKPGAIASWKKPGWMLPYSVPLHKELKRGTLRNLIKDAGLSVDEFVTML